MNILIVEDDKDIREGIIEYLSEFGYIMVGAKDGMDALAKFKENDFKLIKIHGFRHTHASLLFESGNMSIKAVQHRLGHSDIQTTMNIYTHVTQLQKDNLGNDFAKYMEM